MENNPKNNQKYSLKSFFKNNFKNYFLIIVFITITMILTTFLLSCYQSLEFQSDLEILVFISTVLLISLIMMVIDSSRRFYFHFGIYLVCIGFSVVFIDLVYQHNQYQLVISEAFISGLIAIVTILINLAITMLIRKKWTFFLNLGYSGLVLITTLLIYLSNHTNFHLLLLWFANSNFCYTFLIRFCQIRIAKQKKIYPLLFVYLGIASFLLVLIVVFIVLSIGDPIEFLDGISELAPPDIKDHN